MWNLIIQYIRGALQEVRTFLTWPVVTLIMAFMFKSSIADFLRRLVKGEGPGGWKFEATKPAEQQQEIKDKSLVQPEDKTEQYVKDNPKLVIQEFKRTFNAYWFERAYNLIYGTQIEVLEHLETKGDKGDKYINLTPFYNEFLRRSKFTTTQLAHYLGFLKDAQFIEYLGEGANLTARITPYGVDFLSYIKTQYALAYKYKIF